MVGIGAGAALAIAPGAALAQGNSNAGNKVTICHATGSTSNPYVMISPNANGVINGHAGSGHQAGRDIIPPFDYNDHGSSKHFPGQNWNASGQAIFNNGCVPAEGGRGGGNNGGTNTTTTTNNQTQVLGSTTTTGGMGAGVAVVPQGSVNGGGGAASTALNRGSVLGLVGSLLSLGSGLVLFNRRNS